MKPTENLQALADRAIDNNRHQALRDHVIIAAVCLCATIVIGFSGINMLAV